MITKDQIREMSLRFQIDAFTVFREYLQLVFLSYLYQEKETGRIFFKGGTALRLLFGSPRFSEDLDFSTDYSAKEITGLLAKLKVKIVRELPRLEIIPVYSGKEEIRFRMTHGSSDFKYPLNIRLDFHQSGDVKNTQSSTLATPFPVMIFPQVFHLSAEGILKEKLAALQTRRKGRDLFDVWFLLSKGTKPSVHDSRETVVNRIEGFPERELNRDLGKFLPKNQKTIIPYLKKEIVKMLSASVKVNTFNGQAL